MVSGLRRKVPTQTTTTPPPAVCYATALGISQLQTSIIKQHQMLFLIRLQCSSSKSEMTLVTKSIYRDNIYSYIILRQ